MADADVVPLGRRSDDAGAPEPLLRDVMGDLLRRERVAQQRTLSDVAESAQVSKPYLSEVERGLKEPSSEVLGAICRSLGISLVDLVGRTHHQLTTPVPPLQTARNSGPVLLAA